MKLDKGCPFTGSDALRAQKGRGVTRRFVGFKLLDRGIPRHGFPVFYDGSQVDIVRSGCMSPSLGIAIGTTYLPVAAAKVGTRFEVESRGTRIPAEVVSAAVLHRRHRPEGQVGARMACPHLAALAIVHMRVAILTISDACSRGERADGSGDAIAAWAAERGHEVAARSLVPDETGPIARALAEWADGEVADLIVTTGGTGLTARDVTPEATRAVLEREAPGIAEAIRASALPRFPPRGALARVGGRARAGRSSSTCRGARVACATASPCSTASWRTRWTWSAAPTPLTLRGGLTGMAVQILLTLDDLETAVPLNAALESAGFATTMVSAMDDVRAVFRREGPELLILTGAVHESPAVAARRDGARGARCRRSRSSSRPTPSGPSGSRASASPR